MTLVALTIHTVVSMGCMIAIVGVFCVAALRGLKLFKSGTDYLKRLHNIPCSNCAFFTGDYRLKCPVHPITALTEDAIGCIDFESATQVCDAACCSTRACQNGSYQQVKGLLKR